MDYSQLDDYSRRFAAVLFAAHPEWRGHATVDTSQGVDVGSLLVEIPAPTQLDERALAISSCDQEITVAFDYYHRHFNRYAEEEEQDAFAEALAFVADLLTERVAVISWWDGDDWRGSSEIVPGANYATPSWVRGAKTVRTRSWLGAHDQDKEA